MGLVPCLPVAKGLGATQSQGVVKIKPLPIICHLTSTDGFLAAPRPLNARVAAKAAKAESAASGSGAGGSNDGGVIYSTAGGKEEKEQK